MVEKQAKDLPEVQMYPEDCSIYQTKLFPQKVKYLLKLQYSHVFSASLTWQYLTETAAYSQNCYNSINQWFRKQPSLPEIMVESEKMLSVILFTKEFIEKISYHIVLGQQS